jgi:glycosyltransferase involved in cell wall biosynthesis
VVSPDVSVIIPTHRREKLVVRAIESALAQRHTSLEVIVLDDTADGSAKHPVTSISDPRVTYVKRDSPSRGRPALVRNEGIGRAHGRFLHFLDDDDALHDDALKLLLEPLEAQSGVGMSFGLVDAFGDDDEVVAHERSYYNRAASSARSCSGSRLKMAREILFGTVPFITSACLVRREVARSIGGFNGSLAVAEEYEFFLRAIRTYGAVFVDRPVLRHQTGLQSLSRNVDRRVWRASYQSMYDTYRARFGAFEFYALRGWSLVERLSGRLYAGGLP